MTQRSRDEQPPTWATVKARLARAQERMHSALELSEEEGLLLMQERARILAGEASRESEQRALVEVLVLNLNEERYAVQTLFVHEILPLADFTPVPGTPPHFLGLTSVRGEIYAVVDLRPLLGISPRAPTDLFRVVLLGRDAPELGILADATDEVMQVDIGSLATPPPPTRAGANAFIRGMTPEALILLDAQALLSDGRLVEDQGDLN